MWMDKKCSPVLSEKHQMKVSLTSESVDLQKKMPDGNVRITLDDGFVIWGYECWWEPQNNGVQPNTFGVGTQASFPLLGGSQADESPATHGGG
jgi:hypothetical protein